MAAYWRHTCDHTSRRDPWGQGETPLATLCDDCRQARIGETIQFARYGKAPASGTSTNHREHTAEVGLSVYEIVDGQIQHVGWHFGITDRALYLGTGRIVGWGSDGEPVVAVMAIKKATKKQQARYGAKKENNDHDPKHKYSDQVRHIHICATHADRGSEHCGLRV